MLQHAQNATRGLFAAASLSRLTGWFHIHLFYSSKVRYASRQMCFESVISSHFSTISVAKYHISLISGWNYHNIHYTPIRVLWNFVSYILFSFGGILLSVFKISIIETNYHIDYLHKCITL